LRATVTRSATSRTPPASGTRSPGKYRVDYTASYQFLIVEFMKSDGTDGSGFMDTINEYSNSGNVSGSAVVTLTDVSSVAVSNTQGAWSITFTKLGS
jgi:hypothetical protein